MRLFHKQRGAAVPLVLCLKLKNIKSTAGMFLNTQHNNRWNNEVTVLVDGSGPPSLQSAVSGANSSRAARSLRVWGFVLDFMYKILENGVDLVGEAGLVWVSPTPQGRRGGRGRHHSGFNSGLGFYSGTLQLRGK